MTKLVRQETFSGNSSGREHRSRIGRAVAGLKSAPSSALAGLAIVMGYTILAICAPLIAPYGEADIFPKPFAPWSSEHWLGTDQIGRDILSRLIYGARNSIGIAFAATLLAFAVGGSLGMAAAISRNWVDHALSRTADVLMAIPSLIFALMLLSIFGSSVVSLILIIALLDVPRIFRLTRAIALNVVVTDYVEAARARGEGIVWIMRGEILPNITVPVVAEFGLRFCFVFLTIASLSFLGVGIQPPAADWGSMVRETAQLIQFARFDIRMGLTPLVPAAAIAMVTLGVNFVVDWILDLASGVKNAG